MMSTRSAQAIWEGNLREGKGKVKVNSFNEQYTYSSRFEDSKGASPEELIAAAEASCFSMALSEQLAKEGHPPKRVDTTAKVHLDKVGDKYKITTIELEANGNVPGINENDFQRYAETARRSSLITQVMSGANIKLNARLEN